MLLTACNYNSQNNSNERTDINTEVGATVATTTSDINETTSNLPEGLAYQFENGTFISIDSLISPMNKLNQICQGISSSVNFSDIYPYDIAIKLAEFNGVTDVSAYADFMYQRYIQMYGEDFSMHNEYISCTPLSDDELLDMSKFYDEYFFTNITAEYGFIVESTFKVTYKDEAGNVKEDSSIDYYIAYSLNGIIYIDYFYVDTLDL